MRLRQIALVAGELAPVRQQLFTLLGLTHDHIDPGVGEFGLQNSVMAIGDTFLEVVSPVTSGTTAGRQLERRGGDGGYMVLLQTDDLAHENRRIEKLGVRKVWEATLADARAFHLHPKDVGGAILSLDQMTPPASWRWAGPDWQGHGASLVDAIIGVELQAADPIAMAARWGEVLGEDVTDGAAGPFIVLDRGEIRFKTEENGRGDGVSGVDFSTRKRDQILAIAAREGLAVDGNRVTVCGTDFRFLSPTEGN